MTHVLPLTAAQSRLWMERLIDPTRASDRVTLAWDIRGEVSESRLYDAIAVVTQRHDALRVTLDAREPLQVLGESRLTWSLENRGDAQRLTLSLPHECCDERSLATLLHELSASYANRPLPPVEPYRIEGRSYDLPSIEPWSPPTRIAPEFVSDDRDSVAVETRVLPPELRGNRTALLAAFVTLVQRHAGRERIVLGVTTPANENIFGCFDPLLPMTIDEANDVDATWQRLQRYSAIPFATLLDALRPERVAGQHPLFEITFTIAGDRTLHLGDAHATPIPIAPSRAQFDLELSAGEVVTLTYRAAFWPRVWAREFLAQFEAILRDRNARTPATLASATPLPGDASVLFLTSHEARAKLARAIKPQPIDARAIVFIGEPVTDTLIARWRAFFPSDAPIFTMFANACIYEIPMSPLRGVQPIGRPLPGIDVRIVARDGADCAIGEIGDLQINGLSTGDRVRVRSDGAIEPCGRTDRAVWIGGVLVDPANVERALRMRDGVDVTSVIVEEGVDGERRLVAYGTVDPNVAAELAREFPFLVFRARAREPIDDRTILMPADPIELQLVRIWEELLEREPIGVTDDFFALGGDSILAVDLLARIAKAFDLALEPSILLPDATIEHLAHVIRHARVPDASPLVTIQRGHIGRPLVCIHPSGGSVLCYVDLARMLGREQHVVGLRGPHPRSNESPPQHASEVAARYVDALRETQPHGPYVLAGYSFGGLIAYEMAQQLVRAGETIALLVLFDPRYPRGYGGDDRNPVVDLGEVLERYDLDAEHVSEEQEHALWRELIELASRYLPDEHKRRRNWSAVQEFCRLYRLMPATDDLGYHDLRRFLRNLRANFRTMRHYRPSPLAVGSVLFTATRNVDGTVSDHARNAALWATCLPNLDVRPIDANHFNLLAAPSVESVARSLKGLLP